MCVMVDSEETGSRRRGPRREAGAPVGPDEVRRAVLDAAASLFASRGVDRVSLREIAATADVHPALIGRYIGSRDELVVAVFDDLSAQVSAAVLEHPLSGQGFGADTVMGQWARIAERVGDPRRRARRAERVPTRCLRWPRPSARATGSSLQLLGCAPRRSWPRRWAGASSRITSSRPEGSRTLDWRRCARSWPAPAPSRRDAVAVATGSAASLALRSTGRDLVP